MKIIFLHHLDLANYVYSNHINWNIVVLYAKSKDAFQPL